MLEGELYPTASSVIPFLDTVFADLTSMSARMHGAAKRFVDLLLTNLKSSKRFPNGYKSTAPYNVLTLLDLRFAIVVVVELMFILCIKGTLISTSMMENTIKL